VLNQLSYKPLGEKEFIHYHTLNKAGCKLNSIGMNLIRESYKYFVYNNSLNKLLLTLRLSKS
jgi:hypothetical protein